MAPASITVSPLPASKSFSKANNKLNNSSSQTRLSKVYWAHQKGLEAEAKVLSHYLDLGFDLIKQRYKTPYAEIDILLRSREGDIVMVEVKSVSSEHFISYRISQRQKKKQEMALIYLSELFKRDVAAHWAFVMEKGGIVIIEDISN